MKIQDLYKNKIVFVVLSEGFHEGGKIIEIWTGIYYV